MCGVKVNVHSCRKVSLQDKYLVNTGGAPGGHFGAGEVPLCCDMGAKIKH